MNEKIKLEKTIPNIIVAYTSKNRYIGYKGDLPWKRSLRGDMLFVSKLIRSFPNTLLIMGRNTYLSLPKMPEIHIAVVTSLSILKENTVSFRSMEEAMKYATDHEMYPIIFGGVRIYEEAMKLWKCKIFCTIVEEKNILGDRIFPEHNFELENITEEVDAFLTKKGLTKSWELKNNQFIENGFAYSFFCNDNF